MAWKVKTKMEQKVEFICEGRTQKYSISELCRAFNISRPTAYKLIQRFQNKGLEGLLDKSSAHYSNPFKTNDNMHNKIIQLKEKHKLWGAKKIHRLLFNSCLESDIPSVVTVHKILDKNGFVKPQKRLRRIKPLHPIFDPDN